MNFILGLDLGQASDYTAASLLEKQPQEKGAPLHLDVRALHRYALGTPYPKIVEDVQEKLCAEPLRNKTALVVDHTGVGRPITDMFRKVKLAPVPITITGGDSVIPAEGGYRVPKRDLASILQVFLQERRLRIAEGLPLAPVLVSEALSFRVKISAAGHDSYESWREGAHDDLLLATAIGVWYATRAPGPMAAVGWGKPRPVDWPSTTSRKLRW